MSDSTYIPKLPAIVDVVSAGLLALYDGADSGSHDYLEILEMDWPPPVTDADALTRFAKLSELGSWGDLPPFSLGSVRTPKALIYLLMAEYARKVVVPILARNAKPTPWSADDSILKAKWAELGAPTERDELTAYRVGLLDQIGQIVGVKVKKINPSYSRATVAANPTEFLVDITALCRVAATAEKKSGGGGGE